MNTTPVSLLERLKQPAPQDWERFVQLYAPLLHHWARRLGLPDPDALDLVQDVFLVLLRKLPEFIYDRHRSFRAWLRTVLLNKWRDHQRRRTVPVQAGGDQVFAEVPDPDPAELFEEAEYRNYLAHRALQLMKAEFQPTTWQACWEQIVSGKPAAQVAAELQISIDSVYSAKSRVLRRVREELERFMD
jgi:RNA polymerase sigma-70 factor (ECF subfamily)